MDGTAGGRTTAMWAPGRGRSAMRWYVSVGTLVALLAATLLVITAPPASSQTLVSTEADLRAAFGDPAETAIALQNDITLDDDCAMDDVVLRNSATDLVIDGAGFTITQTCSAGVLESQGSGHLTLAAVTVTGGDAVLGGGAIRAFGPVTVRDGSVVTDNASAASGGAIWTPFDVEVIDASLTQNTSGVDGGAIHAFGPGTSVTVTGSFIAGNTAAGDGGAVNATTPIAVTDSVFNSNVAGGSGGAINGQGGDVLVHDSIFLVNESGSVGGAVHSGWSIEVTGTSTLIGNEAPTGGAVSSDADVSISGPSFFVANEATTTFGGAIRASSLVTITGGATFDNNTATTFGGAVSASSGTIDGATFVRNVAGSDGGAVWVSGTVTIDGADLTDNQAVLGGAVHAANVVATGSTFDANVANSGGAIRGTSTVTVTSSTLQNNLGVGFAGAIRSGGDVMVTDSVLSENEASLSTGGAIQSAGGTVTITGSVLADNLAGNHGGAISTHGDVVIDDATFADNHTAGDGGAVQAALGIEVADGTFTGNTAVGDGGALRTGADVGAANSSFVENAALGGGAIHADGSVSLATVDLVDNVSSSIGGAIRSGGATSIEAALLQGNVTAVSGGGIFAIGDIEVASSRLVENVAVASGGGAIHGEAAVTIGEGSSLLGNQATLGGAVWAPLGHVEVVTSTLADNEAMAGTGGAINAASGTSLNSTFSRNVASHHGAAIRTSSLDGLELSHTTVASNTGSSQIAVEQGGVLASLASVIATPQAGTDCHLTGGSASSYSYDTDGSCGLADATDTSAGDEPKLGTLDDNGGPTLTMLPQAANPSPLIDAIPAADCVPSVTTDQRGVSRPQGDGCDIGAVEVELEPPPPGPEDPGEEVGEDPGEEAAEDPGEEAPPEEDASGDDPGVGDAVDVTSDTDRLAATGSSAALRMLMLALLLLTIGTLLVRSRDARRPG